MRNFRDLKIWNNGIDLAAEAYKVARKLPKEELYGLRSQITRAAVSVPANIAEGCGRSGDNDNARFVEIALGSSYELETHLILTGKLGLIALDEIESLQKLIHEEQKMLSSYIMAIKGKARQSP